MNDTVSHGTCPTDLAEYLSIPYVAVCYTVERPDGEWVRHAEYPELPGCAAEAGTAAEALDRLEDRKIEMIAEALARGESPPKPRPPLSSGACGLSSETAHAVATRAYHAGDGQVERG